MPKDFKGGDDILGRILKNQDRKKAKEASKAFQQGAWRGMKKDGEVANPEWVRKMASSVASTQDPFMLALRSVVRAANVLQNAEEGEREQFLQAVWSGGTQGNGDIKDNAVYLSPDVISKETTLKPEWTFDERVDVLTGDAMMLSALKRFATRKAQEKVDGKDWAEQIWYTLETLNAETEILTDFPGFSSYFASTRTYYSDKNAKDMLEARIAFCDGMGIPDLEGAISALKFELMYPDQTLTLPKQYRDAVDSCKAMISGTETSEERADSALDVADFLTKLFPPPDGGGGSGSGSGKSSSKGEGNSESGESDDESDGDDSEGSGGGESGEDESADDDKDEGEGDKGDDKDADKDEKEGKGKDENPQDKPEKKDEGENKPENPNKNKPKPKLPKIGQARAKLGEAVKNQSNKRIAGKSIKSKDVEKTPSAEIDMVEDDSWRGGVIETEMPAMPMEYRALLNTLKGRISALKNHIKLQAEQVVFHHHGLKSGQLDDGSLYKLGIDCREDCLFEQKEVKAKPKLVFGILCDESGSMAGRYHMVRELTIILANAFRDFEGLELCVVGHTTGGGVGGESLWMRHYHTPEHKSLEALAGISSHANNLDGYAMDYFAKKLVRWYPDIPTRHMIVISDGQPSASSYGGYRAMEHMRNVVGKARVWGVNIFGCAIDNAYSWTEGEKMYGPNNFVILPDTHSAIPMLGKYITKLIKKANVLR